MRALRRTPLEPVEAPAGGPPRLFLKREDLLPLGGGSKVPRFLLALERLGPGARLAAFSDYGSHTFSTLAHFARDAALGIADIVLYERPFPADPYRRRLAAFYESTPGVRVRRGSNLGLLARWSAMRLRPRRRRFCLGIGGTAAGTDAAYGQAASDCAAQLADAGLAREPVAHVTAVASGDTQRALRAGLGACGRDDDVHVGVLTGHPAGSAALRLRRAPGARFVAMRRFDWEAYAALAAACHARTGVWLDPGHTIHAWEALSRLPAAVRAMPVVLWVTCPLVEGLPSGA